MKESIQEVLADIRGQAEGSLTKQASLDKGDLDLTKISDEQFEAWADQVEALGEKTATTDEILRLRQEIREGKTSPEAVAQRMRGVKASAYKQALRNLGLHKAAQQGLSPLTLLSPTKEGLVEKLSSEGVKVAAYLLSCAFEAGLHPIGDHDPEGGA